MKDRENILITGAAGFIGFHLSQKLCGQGYNVIGVDNMNDYYDTDLKYGRLSILQKHNTFSFQKLSLADKGQMESVFQKFGVDYVVNLAAQAGVRYSLVNPYAYIESNLVGFLNVLECCRHHPVKHLVYASSSSVYGSNKKMPFSTHDNVDHPISLYAATKKSNELMAHSYSALYNLPATGLRFFTVYGPYGRPDMALFMFTKNIIEGKPIEVYNNGKMKRDFTYVDDIVEAVARVIFRIPEPDKNWTGINPEPSSSFAPYRIYNIGNNKPVQLMDFIKVIEEKLKKKAVIKLMDIQPGDVTETYADVSDLEQDISFRPQTSIEKGISNFIDWYFDFYKIDLSMLHG